MKRLILLVLTIGLAIAPASARPSFHRIGQALGRHPVRYLNITVDLAIAAQTAAAAHCHIANPETCYYTPTLTGVPGTATNIIWEGAVLAAGINLANYLWHREFPQNPLEVFTTLPIIGVEAATIGQNFNPRDTNPNNEVHRRIPQ